MLGEKMDQLNHIVEQILAFARRVEPRLGPVDLRRVLHDLELLTRHKLRQHQVQWRCQLAAGLPLLQADATQLEQAFLNLTLNAVEAMPGGGALEVSARSLRLPRRSPQPTHVAVEFKDTGVGISEEQQRRLTTSLLSSTKAKGTGLGLAIVRRVVETHRGRLHLQSQPGRGTTVTLTLPVNPGPG
jgi:signal transduction histidine kinase